MTKEKGKEKPKYQINLNDLEPSLKDKMEKRLTRHSVNFSKSLLYLEHRFVKKEEDYIPFKAVKRILDLSYSQTGRILCDMESLGLIKLNKKGRYTEIYPKEEDGKNKLTPFVEKAYIRVFGDKGKI